ncbi:DUF3822 family protein [Flavobacterium sp. SM15]|uniref:DUF3822 family protein n=1 Tax=Flavobacterium sp. SM15 TaxID=2908005 RepID=UPI001EDB0553|nr:DUF3822 family protein [Flavobacterium sp. SM15]MCG2611719.1 DUF3822 family protein [Flavobacterium sp. SM15]
MSETPIVFKTYKKLSLQVALNGLSFCVFDTLNQSVKEIHEVKFNHTQALEDQLWRTFVDYPQLTKTYDEILVLHDNNLNTFVPKPLFNEDFLGSYLQYNTKVFETDYFCFDEIGNYEMNNVHVPYVNVNNFLIDQFGSFEYKNVNSVLVSKLLELSRNKVEKQVYIHLQETHFELIITDNLKLVLYNSFEYKTPEDFAYYLLFSLEQLQLNPETITVSLLGKISEEHPCFEIAYRYIRNISLLDVSDLAFKSSVTQTDALQHFTLLNS